MVGSDIVMLYALVDVSFRTQRYVTELDITKRCKEAYNAGPIQTCCI
jgi:hypothetical protein